MIAGATRATAWRVPDSAAWLGSAPMLGPEGSADRFGTLDELGEALTLIQTATIRHFPVVLVGAREWDGLLEWLRGRALAQQRVDSSDLDLLRVVGRPSDVCEIIDAACERQRAHSRRQHRRGA